MMRPNLTSGNPILISNLVTGPFHPDLERSFAEKLRDLKRDDPLRPIAVVAPSQRLADRLKEVAMEAMPQGVAAVHFFNLNTFARSIFDRVKPASVVLLDDALVAEKLVQEIVEQHFSDAPYLSEIVRAPRSARALLGVLHDLKDACVDPMEAIRLFTEEIQEELEGRGGRMRTLAERESPRVAEVLSLYVRYEAELRDRGWIDRHDVARVAAASDFALPHAHVVYYGSYELVQAQIDLLRAVAARVPVTVFYPYVDVPAYAFAREFLEEVLRPMASHVEAIPPSREEPLRLFRPEEGPLSLSIRDYTASGIADEVWIAAKEVVRRRDRGIRRIGVVARSLEPYMDAIESTFRAHAIPFQSSAERPLVLESTWRSLRQLLVLHGRDYSREDVVDFLSSPAVRKPEDSNPIAWDLLTRVRGVGHGVAAWRERVLSLRGQDYRSGAGERDCVIPRAQIDIFCDVLERLFRVGPPPGEGPWEDLAAWGRQAAEEMLGLVPLEWDEGLQSLAKLSAVRPRPREGEFEETLLSVVDGLTRRAGGKAGVQVLDAMAARGLPFDALVVLGMNEKFFPRYILQDPFLRDDVRSRLHHRLGCRIPLRTAGYEEERLLFALLLSSADETVLVRRRSDEKGRLQVRSIFLSSLSLVQTEIPRQPRLKLKMDVPLTPREASVREHFSPGAVERIRDLALLRHWPIDRLERARSFSRAIGRFDRPTKYDGFVGPMEAVFRKRADRGISPTSLERLAQCPFEYFSRHVLELEALLEPEAVSTADVSESGTIYHRALELVLGKSLAVEEAMDRAWRELEERRTLRYPLLTEVRKTAMTETLRRFLEEDRKARGDFVPRHFEHRLQGTLFGVRFRGIADRIDVLGAGEAFRVTDYKRSKSTRYGYKMETGIFDKGIYLQPPIYLLLVAQLFPQADLHRSSSLYAFLEGRPEFKVLEGAFADRAEEFGGVIRRLVDRIRKGRFPIRVDTHCAYCEYATMCRKNHMPTRWRAEHYDGKR